MWSGGVWAESWVFQPKPDGKCRGEHRLAGSGVVAEIGQLPSMQASPPSESPRHGNFLRRYFITGLVAIIPLWITWVVLAFLFRTLSDIGTPLFRALSNVVGPDYPLVVSILESETTLSIVGVALVLAIIFLLGWVTTNFVGRLFFNLFEGIVHRIPFVKTIYGSVRKLIAVLGDKPQGNVQRVVLINFPSPEMKTVGLVTRTLTDKRTGRQLAAVYVPTTPNPTSGYLEIVPVEDIVSTDWTMDEAMTFIVSGGAIAPEGILYDATGPSDGIASS